MPFKSWLDACFFIRLVWKTRHSQVPTVFTYLVGTVTCLGHNTWEMESDEYGFPMLSDYISWKGVHRCPLIYFIIIWATSGPHIIHKYIVTDPSF